MLRTLNPKLEGHEDGETCPLVIDPKSSPERRAGAGVDPGVVKSNANVECRTAVTPHSHVVDPKSNNGRARDAIVQHPAINSRLKHGYASTLTASTSWSRFLPGESSSVPVKVGELRTKRRYRISNQTKPQDLRRIEEALMSDEGRLREVRKGFSPVKAELRKRMRRLQGLEMGEVSCISNDDCVMSYVIGHALIVGDTLLM
jgi:hypothetical protein